MSTPLERAQAVVRNAYQGDLTLAEALTTAPLTATDLKSVCEENERLRADAARLDWMEARVHGTGKALVLAGSCYWSVAVGRTRIGEGDDLRACIDAAIEAAKG